MIRTRPPHVVPHPSARDLAALEASDPTNPFATAAYARVRAARGASVILIAGGTTEGGGALGFVEGPWYNRHLSIASLPVLEDAGAFWDAVWAWCRARLIGTVLVQSFGSRRTTLPGWSVPSDVRARVEWHVAIPPLVADQPTPGIAIGSNHRRNAGKARKAGVTVASTGDVSAAATHAELMSASLIRREQRGESVHSGSRAAQEEAEAILAARAGRIYQARLGEEVLSSLLLLLASEGAYYQSAGSTPEGMDLGASSLLVVEALQALQAEGLTLLNLGGAGPDAPGLVRFKSGFGATPVELQSGRYTVDGGMIRRARTTGRLLRSPGALRRALFRVDRFAVFAAPSTAAARAAPDGYRLEPLNMDALVELGRTEPAFAEQAERARRLGYSTAFGLRQPDGSIGHVAWLVEEVHDRRGHRRNVKLRGGEAEITHALTPPAYRGNGAYPIAVGAIAAVAAEKGIRRLFMITSVGNAASQRGILKAGFVRVATIWRAHLIAGRVSVAIRGHRWRRFGRPTG